MEETRLLQVGDVLYAVEYGFIRFTKSVTRVTGKRAFYPTMGSGEWQFEREARPGNSLKEFGAVQTCISHYPETPELKDRYARQLMVDDIRHKFNRANFVKATIEQLSAINNALDVILKPAQTPQ